MQAEVGMTSEGGGIGEVKAQVAVANMEKQEEGGQIDKGLDYLAASRTGTSLGRTVASKRRFNKENTVRGAFTKAGTTKSRVIAAAYVSLATGKLQRVPVSNGRIAYRLVTAISKTKKGKVKISSKLMYISRSVGNKPVSATHFSREAAERTIPKIPGYFEREGQKQIDRLWK